MPRSYGNLVENTFANGLVSEATGLNFPEGAVTDCLNVIFKEDGSVERRKGISYEFEAQQNTITRNRDVIVEYVWPSVSGNGDIEFVVQQIGNLLYFYRSSPTANLSSEIHATTIDLESFKIAGAPSIGEVICGMTHGNGLLFVTHKYCSPFYVTYDSGLNTLTTSIIDIEIRDFAGVPDGLALDFRPAVADITDAHLYNLLNQGWYPTAELRGGSTGSVLTHFTSNLGTYPANSESWWYYKNTSEQFDYKQTDRTFFGTSRAPAGHYTINPFLTDRSAKDSRVTVVDEETSGYYRPSTCAFFAGRVFYSGVHAQDYAGDIYFTQIVDSELNYGQCYQRLDPTSETNSDLLPTDGGVIKILDAGAIQRIYATQKSLLIFATNGIWTVSGSDVAPFQADDYTVQKIASIPVKNTLSFLDVFDTLIFWTEQGIWSIGPGQTGALTINSLSDPKIKQIVDAIPRECLPYVKGAFDQKNKTAYWLYNTTAPTTFEGNFNYNRILCFNGVMQAFYVFSLYSTNKTVSGITVVNTIADDSSQLVTAAAGQVTTAAGNVYASTSSIVSAVKLFTTKQTSGTTYTGTFAEFTNDAYYDWNDDAENYNYDSYFTTGYKVAAEANKNFQSNYVNFYLKNVSNSSAFVRGIWDFTNSASSHKWSVAQQVYNTSQTNRDYIERKLKIRGMGKSLQFKIYSEAGKPFKIIGWSIFVSGNTIP